MAEPHPEGTLQGRCWPRPRTQGTWRMGREGGSERTRAGMSKGGRDPAPLSIALSPQPSHRIPEPFFRGSQALLADSHKQKGKYLPFYKEKLPLPNKKVISQAVGLDGEAFSHPKETRGPFGCERGQLPASDLGRQEAEDWATPCMPGLLPPPRGAHQGPMVQGG